MKSKTRKASVVQVGGFRPTGDPLATHFGLRPLGLAGEPWPRLRVAEGPPLLFVCQLNLTAAPQVPPLLTGIALLVFFVDQNHGVMEKENGADWCLRAYRGMDGLVPLERPAEAPALKRGFECRWLAADDRPGGAGNAVRTKVGGYPSTIQSEPWWDYQKHEATPQYALQIGSEEKVGLGWGDGGAVYLARGTAAGCEDRWFLDWQCY